MGQLSSWHYLSLIRSGASSQPGGISCSVIMHTLITYLQPWLSHGPSTDHVTRHFPFLFSLLRNNGRSGLARAEGEGLSNKSRCYSSRSREQDGIVGKGRGPIRLRGRGRQSVTCLRYHSSLSHNDLSIIEPALSTPAVFLPNSPHFRYSFLTGS